LASSCGVTGSKLSPRSSSAIFGYAISLLQGILKQEPEFLTGRQLLRRAEVTKHKTEKSVLQGLDFRHRHHEGAA
jgi:hypothetical protein